VAARRSADHSDVVRVDVQTVGVLTQPAQGGLAVVEVLRPGWFSRLGQHVVDAEADVAVEHQVGADVNLACRVSLAARPAAAMNDEHGRQPLPGLELDGHIEIALFLAIGPQVVHVFLQADVGIQRGGWLLGLVGRRGISGHHQPQ
jgi:hypothetical protein